MPGLPEKSVVITGASTGIGADAAIGLAAMGFRVFAGVRKAADGEALVARAAGITPVLMDVTDEASLARAAAGVGEALGGRRLGGLVNNAGIAIMGPLAQQPMSEIRAHFEVNTFGLIAATKAFLPLLGSEAGREGSPGRIVNISSVGGRVASPFLGAYTATKHAVESLTDSLRRELAVYGIDAVVVGPGAVRTPIWEKAEKKNADARYAGTVWAAPMEAFARTLVEGGRKGLDPERVTQAIHHALSADKPKARYAPVPQKLTNFILPILLPKRVVDGVFVKRFGLRRPH
jgi:NAD(P)-dependent dehydrogenase (short-subunit alcohol dehydrogenase family)